MSDKKKSTEYLYICIAHKCRNQHSVLVEAGKKPPLTIPCPRCKGVAQVFRVGK